MVSPSVNALLSSVREHFGYENVIPYGTSDEEEHGTAFRIARVPATFSVHTRDGQMSFGSYDIQIESFPPGEYLYTAEVTLKEIFELIDRITVNDWP